jgi:putative transport protein
MEVERSFVLMLLSASAAAAAPIEQSAARGMAIISLAVVIGLSLGAIRFRGFKLGISGVLFSSLVFGQLGLTVDPTILGFLRDFAMILFVYSIGLQVGPGFVSSLRSDGLRLNVLAVLVLILGAGTCAVVGRWLPGLSASGLYAGAFTTTPGLAAAQEALRHGAAVGSNAIHGAALAYTVTYPFGIVGPVLVVVALRWMFRINLQEERHALAAANEVRRPPIETLDVEVTDPGEEGLPLRAHPLLHGNGVVYSALLRDGMVSVPTAETQVRRGDVLRAVGPRVKLKELLEKIGRPATADLGHAAGDVKRLDLVVTRTQVLRRSLRELDLIRRTGVTVTHVNRAGVDLAPKASLRLVFADRLTVVGPDAGLKTVEAELGNSIETLNRPQLVPIFLGIVLGVIVGSVPIFLPGLHVTLRIGLAGGPMLAAIALSQLGNVGSVIWYMPTSANQLFRDFGLAVFLACVGLTAGNHFIQQAAAGGGLALLAYGAVVTMVPVFLIGCVARKVLRVNFVTLSGWVAGAMTSSPALLFADELAGSDAPAVAYAAVAPLATLVPIICAQVLAIVAG